MCATLAIRSLDGSRHGQASGVQVSDVPVQTREKPTRVSGDLELPGFTLDLTQIWETFF